jgi:hypothetical protein
MPLVPPSGGQQLRGRLRQHRRTRLHAAVSRRQYAGVLTETTADLAWALPMAARRLPEGYDYVRAGGG